MKPSVPFDFERAPGLPGSDLFSRAFFGVARPLTHALWKMTVRGVENVPASGPAIICPNHLSFCDSVFVPASLPRRCWAIGKAEYMDSLSTKYLFPALGMIPIDRSGGEKSAAALDAAAGVLDAGFLFMIYPEGTRSRDGQLHKGRTGAARLAMRCGAPIIPVGHIGTVDVQPPGQVAMSPFKPVEVNIGKPLYAEDFGSPGDPRVFRLLTDAVMFEIAKLSGQTYVDTYAGAKAEARGDVATRPTPPDQDITVAPSLPPGRAATPAPPPAEGAVAAPSLPPGRARA